jgi:hypothetical protein
VVLEMPKWCRKTMGGETMMKTKTKKNARCNRYIEANDLRLTFDLGRDPFLP